MKKFTMTAVLSSLLLLPATAAADNQDYTDQHKYEGTITDYKVNDYIVIRLKDGSGTKRFNLDPTKVEEGVDQSAAVGDDVIVGTAWDPQLKRPVINVMKTSQLKRNPRRHR